MQGNAISALLHLICYFFLFSNQVYARNGLYNTNSRRDYLKLNVHIITHAHIDQNLLAEFVQSATGGEAGGAVAVFSMLDGVVGSLLVNPHRTYTHGELAYFMAWWQQLHPQTQDVVRQLVQQQRFEFVNGGVVQHDEATSHYSAMVHQMSLGMQFLQREFNVTPKVAWQLEGYGHSSTEAFLKGLAGFEAIYIRGSDLPDLQDRQQHQLLELVWRGSLTYGNSTDLLLSEYPVFPPSEKPPAVTWFTEQPRWRGTTEPTIFKEVIDDPETTAYNVDTLVNAFVETAEQIQQCMYSTSNTDVLLLLDPDLTQTDPQQWFRNLDKLVHYANKDGRVAALYSTPAKYFAAKAAEAAAVAAVSDATGVKQGWPVKSDDFFPVRTAESGLDHHAGHYSNRPALKGMVRRASALLTAAQQMEVVAGLEPAGDAESRARLPLPDVLLPKVVTAVAANDSEAGLAADGSTDNDAYVDDLPPAGSYEDDENNDVIDSGTATMAPVTAAEASTKLLEVAVAVSHGWGGITGTQSGTVAAAYATYLYSGMLTAAPRFLQGLHQLMYEPLGGESSSGSNNKTAAAAAAAEDQTGKKGQASGSVKPTSGGPPAPPAPAQKAAMGAGGDPAVAPGADQGPTAADAAAAAAPAAAPAAPAASNLSRADSDAQQPVEGEAAAVKGASATAQPAATQAAVPAAGSANAITTSSGSLDDPAATQEKASSSSSSSFSAAAAAAVRSAASHVSDASLTPEAGVREAGDATGADRPPAAASDAALTGRGETQAETAAAQQQAAQQQAALQQAAQRQAAKQQAALQQAAQQQAADAAEAGRQLLVWHSSAEHDILMADVREPIDSSSSNSSAAAPPLRMCFLLKESVCSSSMELSGKNRGFLAVLYNPLSFVYSAGVRIPVVSGSYYAVVGPDGLPLPSQLLPVPEAVESLHPDVPAAAQHELVFVVELNPLGHAVYKINQTPGKGDIPAVSSDMQAWHAKEDLSISSKLLTVKLSSKTRGISELTKITSGRTFNYSHSLVQYHAERSQAPSASLFLGHGEFRQAVVTDVTVVRGPVVKAIRETYRDLGILITRLWAGLDTLEVQWVVALSEHDHMDVFLQYNTSVPSEPGVWFTDANGKEWQQRAWSFRPSHLKSDQDFELGGNLYPATSGIQMFGEGTLLAMAMDRAHAVTSQQSGQVHVLLHRTIAVQQMRDGRSQALTDVSPALGTHIISINNIAGIEDGALNNEQRNERFLHTRHFQQILNDPLQVAFSAMPNVPYQATSSGINAKAITTKGKNVHVLTLQWLSCEVVLLRLAHMFQAREHSRLAKPAVVDVGKLLKQKVLRVKETGLFGQDLLGAAASDSGALEDDDNGIANDNGPVDTCLNGARCSWATRSSITSWMPNNPPQLSGPFYTFRTDAKAKQNGGSHLVTINPMEIRTFHVTVQRRSSQKCEAPAPHPRQSSLHSIAARMLASGASVPLHSDAQQEVKQPLESYAGEKGLAATAAASAAAVSKPAPVQTANSLDGEAETPPVAWPLGFPVAGMFIWKIGIVIVPVIAILKCRQSMQSRGHSMHID